MKDNNRNNNEPQDKILRDRKMLIQINRLNERIVEKTVVES